MIRVTAGIDTSHYKTELVYDNKTIIVDEPLNLGGQNLGFTPSALLASSLASCTAITLRMYADRKKWDLQETMVEVAFEKHETSSEMVMDIKLFGNLDERQKSRLLEIAHNCPIHKALMHPIHISTSLKD